MKQRGVTESLHVEKMAPTDIHWHLLNVSGDQTVAMSTVRGWVVCFSSGNSNVKDKPRSGWPCKAVTSTGANLSRNPGKLMCPEVVQLRWSTIFHTIHCTTNTLWPSVCFLVFFLIGKKCIKVWLKRELWNKHQIEVLTVYLGGVQACSVLQPSSFTPTAISASKQLPKSAAWAWGCDAFQTVTQLH